MALLQLMYRWQWQSWKLWILLVQIKACIWKWVQSKWDKKTVTFPWALFTTTTLDYPWSKRPKQCESITAEIRPQGLLTCKHNTLMRLWHTWQVLIYLQMLPLIVYTNCPIRSIDRRWHSSILEFWQLSDGARSERLAVNIQRSQTFHMGRSNLKVLNEADGT
jgi:hypothetical protein